MAEAIRREALRTHALARDLLDLARLQSDTIMLSREWLPVDEMVSAALRTSSHAIRHHHLALEIADNLSLLHVDPVMMERALCNLLEKCRGPHPGGRRHPDQRTRVLERTPAPTMELGDQR